MAETKMPRMMKVVYAQIHAHPSFPFLSEGYHFAIGAAEHGYSHCKKANDKWIRQIWRWLYEGGPDPDGEDEKPPTEATRPAAPSGTYEERYVAYDHRSAEEKRAASEVAQSTVE